MTNNDGKRRVVHTRINTSLEDWKRMLLEEVDRMKVDRSFLRPLAIQHAWEIGDTPISYATILRNMQNQRARNIAMKRTNYASE